MKHPERFYRLVAVLGVTLSVGVLVISFLAIGIYTSNPWPWKEMVHESGDRSLTRTILYYEHAARELPLDIILGVVIGGSVLFVFPGGDDAARIQRVRRRNFFGVGTLAVVCTILAGTWWTGGSAMIYENLLQFPTRPGEPLLWGGHWRYHLLSHITLMLVAFGLSAPVLFATRSRNGNSRGMLIAGAAIGLFAVLALVFIPRADSFANAVYLGHQVREVFTHILVTVPMAWGVCLYLARKQWARNGNSQGTTSIAIPIATGLLGGVVGLFLLARGLATSAADQGQSQSLAVLIFPHFFEHTFSYLVAVLSAGLAFEWGMLRNRSRA